MVSRCVNEHMVQYHLNEDILSPTSLQVIKLYAWEIPFQCLISGTRQQELDELKKISCIDAVSTFMWMCATMMVRK